MHIADDKILIIVDKQEALQLMIALKLAAFFGKNFPPGESITREYENIFDTDILEKLGSMLFAKSFQEASDEPKAGD